MSVGESLVLRSFGVAFGDRVVLEDVSFRLPEAGMTLLVGPAGVGKSTLIRTLSGLNRAHAELCTWGTALLHGVPVLSLERESASSPALVMQHARFFLDTVRENLVSALPNRSSLTRADQSALVRKRLEANGLSGLMADFEHDAVALPLHTQRKLAIAHALLRDPPVLLVDEPTAGLEEQDALEVVALLSRVALRRAVVLVTHNQRHALQAGGTTLLLAGGKIQEATPTEQFFRCPVSEAGSQFLRTGGCRTPPREEPDTPQGTERNSNTAEEAPPRRPSRSCYMGPRGFFWVKPGVLGGLPRPGIIDALDYDLEGLKRLDVSVLVTLEEERTVALESLCRFDIRSIHFPIADMGVPCEKDTLELCRSVTAWNARGDVVAFHCRAGLGRTGTLLACQLISEGESARGALETLRAISPRSIQSQVQVEFLRAFESALRRNRLASGTT